MTLTAPSRQSLAQIYREQAYWTQVYADLSVDSGDPPDILDERRTSIVNRLRERGAPDNDIDTVVECLTAASASPSPVSVFLLIREGEVVIREVLPGHPVEPEISDYGTIPNLVPLLRSEPLQFRYVVVETSRDGGEVRLFHAGSATLENELGVEGRTDTLHKVPGGGWRHDHLQNHTEELWRQTQAQLADLVDDVVRTHRPRLLVVAGDIRARQLLESELSEASRAILEIEPTNTRADGSKDDALENRINTAIERIVTADKRAVVDALRQHDGRGDKTVELGIGPVVRALASAQVDTLIIDTPQLGERELLALDAVPWVAAAPEEALTAGIIRSVPAQLALVRAALATDARVLFAESSTDPEAEDAVRLPQDTPAAALLRWRTGPAVPGIDPA